MSSSKRQFSIWLLYLGALIVLACIAFFKLRPSYVSDISGKILLEKSEILYRKKLHNKLANSRWPLGAYRHHSLIGYELTPSFSAALRNKTFWTKTHSLGFRIPRAASQTDVSPGGILAIGDSFTYGDMVEAEHTFVHLAAASLDSGAYNYGVCGYSYASSLLQLEELERQGVLDKLQPSAIVVGAGYWLEYRSQSPFLPTDGPQLRYPYFGKRDGKLAIVYPEAENSLERVFALQRSYFPSGVREDRLTPQRLSMLAEISQVSRQNEQFSAKWKPEVTTSEMLHEFHSRLYKISSKRNIPLIFFWMALRPSEAATPAFSAFSKAHSSVYLANGSAALEGLPWDDATIGGHPSKLAHSAYGKLLGNFLKKIRQENTIEECYALPKAHSCDF